MAFTVITTIQGVTASLSSMVETGRRNGVGTIVVGDRKTPAVEWPEDVLFLSLASQGELESGLAGLLPENHYARKNLGYLLAISRGAAVIFDTDDDNRPLTTWSPRHVKTLAAPCLRSGWANVYAHFTRELIWPRGLPLEAIGKHQGGPALGEVVSVRAPIQQGLANGSPDVDAIWRLTLDKEITFEDRGSIWLPKGSWCPFNSQSTWWFPEAYPLMYLPSFVSFRMTDIWRSFIAQRCLWELGYGLVFHGPEMYQDRNPHNLLRDFEQEIPGYLRNEVIRNVLEKLELSDNPSQVSSNMYRCYESLVAHQMFPAREMLLLDRWLSDLSRFSL